MSLMLKDELLPNGVRLITEHNPASMSASIGFFVKIGSRDEGESLYGCSHFLEHLLFKGTETRSALDISSTLENLGGFLNAFTDRDMTAYYARILSKDQSIATELLLDMYQNAVLNADDVEMERKVIIEEINQFQDDPASLIHELYVQNIWRDNSLAHPISGTVESIRDMPLSAIKGFYGEHYGKELTLVASGAFDYDRLVSDVTTFTQKGLGKLTKKPSTPQYFPGKNYVERKTGQVQLALATHGISYGQKDSAALTILSSYLGMGASSKLFQEVREKRGLVYNIYCYNQSLEDTGSFAVIAATTKANVDKVIDVVLDELDKTKQGLGVEVLETVKHKTIGMFILGSESNRHRMHQLGVSTLRLGKPRTLTEIVSMLESVTDEDIQHVAEYLFDKNYLSITALGMTEDEGESLSKYFS